ncbi:hypothetical protein [Hymenobacter cellulosivorans]|uniref:DUF3592 domain-containing protein n=1 Tax=Hymenobacter cellulosivorans TaxID=2932249 RepID=A0ABY4FFW8_9BACT|nr:hypothetical protein [Hymenobacter cellulosivorans]UOQ55567.1 hypothetical protein MUN80_12585 [Hymenobacter cellulosivorans]
MWKNLPVFLLLAFGALIYYYFQRADEVHAKGKYTIGYIDGAHWAVKSGRQIDYSFSVAGKSYTGGEDELPQMQRDNARYLIKYDSTSPDWHAVYFSVPIPDSITDAPSNGWQEPPFPVPAKILQR